MADQRTPQWLQDAAARLERETTERRRLDHETKPDPLAALGPTERRTRWLESSIRTTLIILQAKRPDVTLAIEILNEALAGKTNRTNPAAGSDRRAD
jgi:hypothetical protein